MEVKKSEYIEKNKKALNELLNKALKKYAYVSILATDSYSKTFQVNRVITTVKEDPLLSNRGFVIKAYDGKTYAEYSFNDFSKEKILDVLSGLKHVFEQKITTTNDVTQNEYNTVFDDQCVNFDESTEFEQHPSEIGNEKIVNELTRLKDLGLGYSDKILNCTAVYSYQEYTKLFLSKNKTMEQSVMWSNGVLLFAARKEESVKVSYSGFSMCGGAELLKTMESKLNDAAQKAVDLLDSVPMIPGEYDCICTPEVTGMIAHEAFGHGVEMDMFVKDRALAKQYIGKQVASEKVTMHDGAKEVSETASYFFDDEGTLAHDTVIIRNGILENGISDLLSAMNLETIPTGNGRRESYERKAYTRMTNTYFEAGTDKPEDMIKSVSYGFLLENPTSGMEDPKNWGIQCMVSIAREIKDGKLTGKIFSPCVLSGYVPDLLKSISMVSDKIELCGTGFCGKGYKEWVKVSDGGPYIKARIHLG